MRLRESNNMHLVRSEEYWGGGGVGASMGGGGEYWGT